MYLGYRHILCFKTLQLNSQYVGQYQYGLPSQTISINRKVSKSGMVLTGKAFLHNLTLWT